MKQTRFNYLIYPPFQLKTLGYLIGAIVAVSLIYLAGFWFLIESIRDLGHSIGLTDENPFFQFLNFQFEKIFIIYTVSTLAVTILFAGLSILITHKIAGPIVKLKRYLRDHIENPESPMEKMEFRKGDFFKDLTEDFNEFIEKKLNPKDK